MNIQFEGAFYWLEALPYALPRVLLIFSLMPIFSQDLFPNLIRYPLFLLICTPILPTIRDDISGIGFGGALIVSLVLKEAIVGLFIGFILALPFWMFEGVGFLIDNQRGASISATLDPLTGNDSSPLGEMFYRFCVVVFLSGSALHVALDIIYDSFFYWRVSGLMPIENFPGALYFARKFGDYIMTMFVLCSPALIAMFLVESGLAIMSRFIPSLQVFFLAMPLKTLAVIFLLYLHVNELFGNFVQHFSKARIL